MSEDRRDTPRLGFAFRWRLSLLALCRPAPEGTAFKAIPNRFRLFPSLYEVRADIRRLGNLFFCLVYRPGLEVVVSGLPVTWRPPSLDLVVRTGTATGRRTGRTRMDGGAERVVVEIYVPETWICRNDIGEQGGRITILALATAARRCRTDTERTGCEELLR